MREAAHEAFAVLWHEANERMENSQYCHFLSQAKGAEAMVLPDADHDRIWCFTDLVKLTHALIWDLDEAVKEVKHLGEHEEESSQKIMELEALCKKLREDAYKLKASLEGMVESHHELITKIAWEIGLDCMGEDAKDEEEDDDADDGGDAATPPALAPPATAPEEIIVEEEPMEMVPEQEALVAHEVILVDAEPEMPQPFSTTCSWGIMRKARPGWWMTWMIWMMTQIKAALTWMNGFTRMESMIGIELSSQSLMFRFKNKPLGFTLLNEL
jgi:hypothetical protein